MRRQPGAMTSVKLSSTELRRTQKPEMPSLAPHLCAKLDGAAPAQVNMVACGVVYYATLATGTVNLLIVYPKSTTDNLSQAFLKELRKLVG